MEPLIKRLAPITESIAAAQAQWNHTVKLIAVTKNRTSQEIEALKSAKLYDVGENRVQEIMQKAPSLKDDFRIHMIGVLQTNKVKYIMNDVCQIQSVDRLSLAEEINRHAIAYDKRMNVLVEVSPAGEAQKGGVSIPEAEAFIRRIAKMKGLYINGLMAVMPLSNDTEYLDRLFHGMRILFDRLRREAIPDTHITELSMGMSNDYRIALKNGANVIRIGTALFGSGR